MKYVVASDIHGSLPRLEKVLAFFNTGNYDILVILGDILNYGPRNGVPEGLNAPAIVERLNHIADKVIAVRGNCDAEVDQMLLSFPMMADYVLLVIDGKKFFLTHGHKYTPDNRPRLGIDVFFSGHTHLWELERREDVLFCNTGSITFPKGGNEATFATIEEGKIQIRNLDGTILKEQPID